MSTGLVTSSSILLENEIDTCYKELPHRTYCGNNSVVICTIVVIYFNKKYAGKKNTNEIVYRNNK